METQKQTQNKQQVTVEKVSVPKKNERFNRITTVVLWVLAVSFIIKTVSTIMNIYYMNSLYNNVFFSTDYSFKRELGGKIAISEMEVVYSCIMAIILLVLVIKQRTIYGLLLLMYAYGMPIFKFILLSFIEIFNTNVSIAYILGQNFAKIAVVLLLLTIAMLCKHNGKTGFKMLMDLDGITMYM